MVEKLTAYRTEDGKFFGNELNALEHDTRRRLETCVGEVCTVEIMGKLLGVYAIIGPLAEFLSKENAVATEEASSAHRQ